MVLIGILCLAVVVKTIPDETASSTPISINELQLNTTLKRSSTFSDRDEQKNIRESMESLKAPEVITDDSGFMLRGMSRKQQNMVIISVTAVAIFILVWMAWCYLSNWDSGKKLTFCTILIDMPNKSFVPYATTTLKC